MVGVQNEKSFKIFGVSRECCHEISKTRKGVFEFNVSCFSKKKGHNDHWKQAGK
jgi:hypothetical protein